MTKHLSREQLLRYLDGELSNSAMRETGEHLQACWSCQAEFGRLKEHIAAIIDAKNTIFEPSLPPPSGPWPRLEPRLEEILRRRIPLWKKLLPFASGTLRAQLTFGAAALVLVAIGSLVWLSVRPASAKEVLRRMEAAEATRLTITEQQVIRQRVSVKKTSRRISSEHLARLESWKSTRSTYWRSRDDSVNGELLDLYRANGMASALPLSSPAAESWAAIARGEPTAVYNAESIDVRVVSARQVGTAGLEEVSFHVERGNWHLDQMTLSFTDATYQITEEESSVLTRNDVPKDVMTMLEPPEPTFVGHVPNLPRPEAAPAPAPAVDLDDLEMEVRYDLHQAGLDLGEGIGISARPPDRLQVDARMASPETKEKVIALFANKPFVQVELQSPAITPPQQAITKTIPQTSSSPTPPDSRLLMFFGGAEEQENYTRSVLEASNDLLTRLYALGELAHRWPPDEQGRLSAGAKSSLETMVRDHARQVEMLTSGLITQLEPLLKHLGYPISESFSLRSGTQWQQASDAALDAARGLDRVIRSLLTSSDAPISPDNALPQLRQSLGQLKQATSELSRAVQ